MSIWLEKVWQYLKRKDQREYTLMLVPHQGQAIRRLRIPIRWIKAAGVGVVFLVVIVSGIIMKQHLELQTVAAEQAEIVQVRAINAKQAQTLQELAKETEVLQTNMNKLNNMDAELRRMAGIGSGQETSRADANRGSAKGNGEGGPVTQPTAAELLSLVRSLNANTAVREQSFAQIKNKIEENKAIAHEKQIQAAMTPSIWPANGTVTSRFGWRSSPWGEGSEWHPGLDIAGDYGSPILAAADGVVRISEWYGGYGQLVEIDHGNGIVTLYGHNSSLLVSSGEHVHKGQPIALMGSTGYSTGTHCHYEVRVNGTAVDPYKFLS